MNSITNTRVSSFLRHFFITASLVAAVLPAQMVLHSTVPYINVSTGSVVNPRSFPVNVLLVHFRADGSVDAHQTIRLAGNTSSPITVPPSSNLMFVALDPNVTKTQPPKCMSSAGNMQLTPALIHEELGITERAATDSRKAEEAIGMQKGAIRFDQYMDEVTTERNDPLQAELKSEERRNMTSQQSNLATQQDLQDAKLGAIQDTIMFAMSNSDAIDAHNSASAAEAEQVQGMIVSKQDYIAKLRKNMVAHSNLVSLEREFTSNSVALLTGVDSSFDIPKGTQIDRCPGAANDKDYLGLKLAAPANVKLIVAKAKFDKGGDEDIIFNRLGTTPQFVATVYWPLEGSSATVSARDHGSWKKLGEIHAGRPSIQQQVATQEKAINSLKKAKRNDDYAAEGGDEVKTAIIP